MPVRIGIPQLSALTTGVLLGMGAGMLLSRLALVEALTALVFGGALLGLVWFSAPREDRKRLTALCGLALSTRLAVLTTMYFGSLDMGRQGFVTGDDLEYFAVSSNLGAFLRGDPVERFEPPYFGGKVYLFGTWVYLETALLHVFGGRALVPILLNAVLGTAVGMIAYGLARSIFDARSAFLTAVVVSLYPSLVLWSSLNLKDALALALLMVVLWTLHQFQRRPKLLLLALVPLLLVPYQTLRAYIFTGLTLIVPVAVVAAPRLRPLGRVGWGALATAVSFALLLSNNAGLNLGPSLLEHSTAFRQGMAAGARTSFQDAPPVSVETGTTFVIAAAEPAPTPQPPVGAAEPSPRPRRTGGTGAAPSACPSPARVLIVPPNVRLIVEQPGSRGGAAPPKGATYVRPCDIVVVGSPETTPRPETERTILRPLEGSDSVELAPARRGGDDLTRQTLAYLPRGLIYALFAPWPWLSTRPIDLLAAPEMLAWYVIMCAAAVTLWMYRRRWRLLLPLVLFVGGTVFIFALVEGNFGTLFRHRAMIIPATTILAGPTLYRVWQAMRGQPQDTQLG